MSDKKKAIWTDGDTHTEIAIMAAIRKTTIGKVLKKLVNDEKKREYQKTGIAAHRQP